MISFKEGSIFPSFSFNYFMKTFMFVMRTTMVVFLTLFIVAATFVFQELKTDEQQWTLLFFVVVAFFEIAAILYFTVQEGGN